MAGNPIEQQWAAIREKVDAALQDNFPVEGRTNKLVLNAVHFDETKADHRDLKSQEAAKNSGRTWGVPVYGDISLVDKVTGKQVDRQKVRLLTVPKMTPRFSYIVDGAEKQVESLWRLRSGIYAHQKQDGTYRAEFNLKTSFAGDPRLNIPFDPEKKQFKLIHKTSKIPLYSVLKTLGVQDEDMKKAWGDEIYQANVVQPKKLTGDITKLYDRLVTHGVPSVGDKYDDKAAQVVKTFHAAELLPDVTNAVLGKPIDHVNGEALLLASKRVLGVARGDIKQDDRDSLVFKTLHGFDDFLHDHLTKPQVKRTMKQKVGNNINRQTNVRDIVSGDLFGKPLKDFFTNSPLANNPDQVNPLEMLSNHRATTTISDYDGGISSERMVTGKMKLINATHFGFLDPLHTPEGEKTGVTLHLPLGVKKVGNEARAQVFDLKTGKITHVGPAELHSAPVVLPDQVTWKNGKPTPIASAVKTKDPKSHEIIDMPFKDGRYLIISAHQLFDESSNLIPFLQNNQGNRTMVAAKQLSQAVSLHHREPPHVQVRAAGGASTWERTVGTPWAHESPVDGKVVAIKTSKENGHADAIVIQGNDGKKHDLQLYNHFALNEAKSFMHSTPHVKVGDKVKKDQVIADSNFTRGGSLALGTNMRVSYLPYKGYNFEDGIVISESAARKLTSEHMHRSSIELNLDTDHLDKKKFLAYASSTAKQMTREQADKIGDDGVIRVGAKVMPGDVLLAAIGKNNLSGEAARAIGRLDRKMFDVKDKSIRWDSQHPGEVVKVVKSPNGKDATVFVKTLEPAEIGDKMVGRHGNKGIITRILPNSEMPRIGGPDGTHVEILMNPSGVPTRINLGQMLETAAGKIAAKTGTPYIVQNFGGAGVDYTEKVKADLKKHGLSDQEAIYDPTTGRKLGDALTGNQYIMKLKHQVEGKLSVRGGSAQNSYTVDHSPKGTGAANPGQGVGQLEFYSMLAHGARHNLRDMATYKTNRETGDNNDETAHIDFWQRVMTGQPLPPPKSPFAYKKFETLLTGLGVNIKKEGNSMVLQPLTDKGVLALSNGELTDPGRVLRGKDAKELEKGLFDPKITGGLANDVGKGLKWSHIALPNPVPNPVFVGQPKQPGPAVILSGLSYADFEDVARGKKYIDGKTGGKVINDILKKVDVKAELKATKAQLPKLTGTALDKANRKAKYLTALDNLGMKAHEAYVMNVVPVIPPIFRPIIPMQDGSLRFDDINHYYKAIGHVSQQLASAPKELEDVHHQDLHEDLYNSVKALAGLPGGKPIYESSRKFKGILETISGDNPKKGFFQNKLMKRRQDLSMRSTIIPEPAMHLDHVGLPKDAAMELYKPFVVREMGTVGYNPIQALKEIKQGSSIAWQSLQTAMDKRPVLLKRDPALHKFSIMSFKPKIVEGKAIKIHPLVTAGYNADFDGDTMSAFVPLTQEAVDEAHKMFPSNNLFSSTHGGIMYSPDQESLLGLHLMAKWGKQSSKSFPNLIEAQKAADKGQLHVTDVTKINGHNTTLGRLLIHQYLPDSFRKDETFTKALLMDPKFEVTKRTKGDHTMGVHDLLEGIAKHDPKNFAHTVDHLKNLGNKYSYELGSSFGLKDLKVNKTLRDGIIAKADAEVAKLKGSQAQKNEKAIEIYSKTTQDLIKAHEPGFKSSGNKIYEMIDSGARGKMNQFAQMTIAPMLMKDGAGGTLATPVKKSYAEGLDVGDYWTSLHGARMGTLQRAQGTSEPGALTKEIINLVIPNMVVSKDCGTSHGISMEVSDPEIHDRFLAAPQKLPGGKVLPAGTLIDPAISSTLKKHKVEQIVVRSPLKCAHGNGLCSKCFGLNENGHLHELGTNVGVIAGHSMGEPATQLAMDSFHTGGVANSRGGGAVDKFTRLNQLLGLPKKLPNAAVLARTTGKVQKIEKDKATNGWNVHVDGEKHFVPAQRQLIYDDKPLSVGMKVSRGKPLSDGHINPRDLLRHTDIHHVQNHITDELHNGIYKEMGVKRRNIETVVRSLTNLTRITHPGHSDHLHGDVALRTAVDEHNRSLRPGQKPIEHTPILRSSEQVALDQHDDWMARLNFRRLKDTLLEGSAKSWKTHLHGTNPIASYAHGAEFGRGTKDRPHLY